MKRSLLLLFPLVTACGAEAQPPLQTASTPQTTSAPTAPASATPPTATAPDPGPPAAPTTFEAEYRQLLDEMVAVDTSHGNETKLLEPIAARYRRLGIPVQILESAPGRGNMIARLKGSGAKKPLLLIAHVDVVPIEGQPWTVPPFKPLEKDGFLWGRGVNDDKGMAAAVVAITLAMAREKTPLTRDVIVALTAGEETGGFAGARWLTENHKELLDAEVALNEGGAIGIADDFSKPLQISLQVSEKSFQTYRVVAHGKGGHSSRPPTTEDPVMTLARALLRIGDVRFPARALPEVKAELEREKSTADKKFVEALGHVVSSAPRVLPADDKVLSESAQYNAMLRTTCVTTMLQAAPQDNVLPTTAEATINCRILPGDTRAQVQEAFTKAVHDLKVEILAEPDRGDGIGSPFEGEVIDAVRKAAGAAFPGIPVLPSMSTGATDSRFLRAIGIRAYGVSPLAAAAGEGKTAHIAHGPDERCPLQWLDPGIRYFREIVRTLVL